MTGPDKKDASPAKTTAAKPAAPKKATPTPKAAEPANKEAGKRAAPSKSKPAGVKPAAPKKTTPAPKAKATATEEVPAPATPMGQADKGPIRQAEGHPTPPRSRAFGSFVALVALPLAALAFYLWEYAADQYASDVGFSVRSTETQTAFEFLGSMTSLGGASNYDSQVLFDYLESQIIVASIDEVLDVQAMWSKPENDPLLSWQAGPSTIEDLTKYWQRMVDVNYDENSGLIHLQIRAFSSQDAQRIAEEILSESVALVNKLAETAQEDAIRFAAEELERAEERLKQARREISTFRNTFQIVDPSLDLQAQMEIFGVLEQQKTDALIELDLLRGTTRENDPRIAQAERRLAVIEERLAEERSRIGGGLASMDGDSVAMSEVLGQYEALSVEREFAEGAYVAALASFDRARAEAGRQSLYLATHIPPTLPEAPTHPKREQILAIAAGLLLAAWILLRVMRAAFRQRQ